MTSDRVTRFALAAGAAALAATAAVSACAPAAKDAPATSSTTPATSGAPEPSEKAVVPGGPSAFTPTINPAPVPTN
jgi:hypothetical protein